MKALRFGSKRVEICASTTMSLQQKGCLQLQ